MPPSPNKDLNYYDDVIVTDFSKRASTDRSLFRIEEMLKKILTSL